MKIDKLKILFIHIPKTAGSSIEHFFTDNLLRKELFEEQDFENYIDTWPDLFELYEFKYKNKNIFTKLFFGTERNIKYKLGKSHFAKYHHNENRYSSKTAREYGIGHMGILEYRQCYMADFNDYFKFTIVRNPWDRLISLYTFIPTVNSQLTDKYKEYCKKGFKEFVAYIKKNDLANSNDSQHIMFKKQVKFVYSQDGKLLVDYVGKFENLQNVFKDLCDQMGIPQEKLLHLHKTDHKKYTEYYDDETIKIVAEIYMEDIKTFNYFFGQ